MGCRLAVTLATVTSFTLANCTGGPPTAVPTSGEGSVQPMDTPTQPAISLPTDTPVPPTVTSTPEPTATATPTTTPLPPTSTPRPATHTVCGSGCDFTTIQAAVDATGPAGGAVIEIRDGIHTEPGIVISEGTAVTVRGLGADETVVQAHEAPEGAPERVFLVEEGATLVLERMTIRHGRPSRDEECGGGIMNLGSVTLNQCVVGANRSNSGAGICTRGTLEVINSSVSDNFADGIGPSGYACGSGGGIKCERGTLKLVSSTVSGNTSEDADIHADRARGGGVHVGCNCTAAFTNTTVSGNTSVAYAGGVYIKGALRLVNCTITDNATSGEGGGVYVRGHLDVVNTIMAHNAGKGGNCVIGGPGGYQGKGEIGVNTNNLVVGGTCHPTYTEDPMLGPLADNGGDTLTHALLPGSPAIDAVSAISCTVATDQRGALRPVVQMSPKTPCDIGAFEVQDED
jgi:hypothetical protein